MSVERRAPAQHKRQLVGPFDSGTDLDEVFAEDDTSLEVTASHS